MFVLLLFLSSHQSTVANDQRQHRHGYDLHAVGSSTGRNQGGDPDIVGVGATPTVGVHGGGSSIIIIVIVIGDCTRRMVSWGQAGSSDSTNSQASFPC
jgi:hypothetical protein